MLDLSAFSPRILRDVVSVVKLFPPSTPVEVILSVVNQNISAQDVEFSTVKTPTICPSCGRGHITKLAAVDGLNRIGCRRCYYSEVV
jgi:ribosomal protein S27AE